MLPWPLWWYGLSLDGWKHPADYLPQWAPGWAHAESFRRKPPPDSLQGRRKEQQPDSVATEKKFRFLPVWVQAAPSGCCPALRDAPAYQMRLEHQRRVYEDEVHSASGKSCCCLFGYSQKQLGGQKYPQGVLPPEPGGKDCRGFGALPAVQVYQPPMGFEAQTRCPFRLPVQKLHWQKAA